MNAQQNTQQDTGRTTEHTTGHRTHNRTHNNYTRPPEILSLYLHNFPFKVKFLSNDDNETGEGRGCGEGKWEGAVERKLCGMGCGGDGAVVEDGAMVVELWEGGWRKGL